MAFDLADTISNLSNGDHLCLFYENPAEQLPVLIRYLREGLARNEQCLYVVDDQTLAQLSQSLTAEGIDVRRETERGALRLWTRQEWRQPGELSSARKKLQVLDAVQQAIQSGFSGIRFAIEMTWVLGPDITPESIQGWEAILNTTFTRDLPATMICQYNRQRLGANIALGALRTHPLLVLDHRICRNYFYEAPLILGSSGNSDFSATADWMTSQLRETKAAEEKREALNKQQMDTVLSLMPAAVYVCDAEGRITYFNQRAADIWGRAPNCDQQKYCGAFRILKPDGSPLAEKEIPAARVLATGEAIRHAEAVVERPDGSRVEISLDSEPLPGAEGGCRGVITVFQDITDLKQAEALRWKLSAIVESSDDAIVGKDLNGIIASWNHGAERLFGYSAEEIIGKPVTTLMPPDRYDEEPGILERIRSGGHIDHYETVRQRKDGSLIEISLSVSPVKDANGRIVGAAKIARDITERKRADENLRRAKDELARANAELEKRVRERTAALEAAQAARLRNLEEQKRLEEQLRQAQRLESIGALAGGIAHDFNNILNIIKGYVEILPREKKETAEALAIVDNAIERGASVIKELLTVARKSDTRPSPVDANRLLTDLGNLLKQILPKTIEVNLQLDAKVKAMMADAGQLTQALLNLCVNARDAMPSGGALALKTCAAGRQEVAGRFPDADAPGYVRIEVMDNGTGMSDAVRRRIFEPVFTTKENGQGTGLGLAIVYGIVKSHGGFIDVVTTPGAGTTFALYLPVAQSGAQPATADSALPHPNGSNGARRQTVILIAEDEPNMRSLLARTLSRTGYEVIAAADGQEVIELYRRHKQQIQIVLLDVGLPKIHGWDLIQHLKRENPGLKIIVTSGYIDPSLKTKMDQAGIDAIVYKPYALGQIAETLQGVLGESPDSGQGDGSLTNTPA